MTDEAPCAEEVRRSTVAVGPARFERVVVRTRWLQAGDDIAGFMRQHLLPLSRPGDVAIVSEKAVVVAAGLGVPKASVAVTPLAEALARQVRPVGDSRGLSIPAKMQFVVDEVGLVRIAAATVVAAITRPIGLRGGFYIVAGRFARSVDGLRPPFEHLLLPPLHPRTAHVLALRLADQVGLPVAIVDINDRGGTVRAVSQRHVSRRQLLRVLRDNPLGQRDSRTPIGLVRRVGVEESPAAGDRGD